MPLYQKYNDYSGTDAVVNYAENKLNEEWKILNGK